MFKEQDMMSLKDYFTEFKSVNTLPPRSYYIPFESEQKAMGGKREDSGRFLSLNGQWQFKAYPSFYDAEQACFLSAETEGRITVP